jgi:hypothetical protein
MTLARRQFLQFTSLGAALTAAPGRLLHAAEDPFPLGDLEAHLRMRGNPRGERSYWYYKGTVFGNSFGEVTRPMLGVEGISHSIIEALPEGRYRYRLNEAGYYSDPETGVISDRVMNPFSGEYFEPQHYLSPQTTIFAPDLSVTPATDELPPGLEYRGRISPLRVFRNTVISSEDLFVRLPHPQLEDDPDRLPFTVQTSLATFTADRRDLLNEDLAFVPCQFNYQTLATFRPWMGMGRRPAMQSWRMVGTKCRREELPAPLVERIASEHDGFFS